MKCKTYNKILFDKDDLVGGGSEGNFSEDEFTDLFGDISPAAEAELDAPPEDPPEEENNTDPDESDPPVEELPEQEPTEETPEPGEEEAETPAETPEAPSEEPSGELSEMEMLRINNERLLKLVNEMSGGKPPKPPTPSEPKFAKLDMSKVFEGFDFDKVVDTKEGFMEFFTKAMTEVQAQTASGLMESLPSQIGSTVQQQTSLQKIHDEFYSTHTELATIKPYVAQVASEISSTNPDMALEEVLKKTAVQVRSALGLPAEPGETVTPSSVPASKKPTLPGSSNTRKPAKPKSGIQSEIDDLLND